jgi:hypothetical protein
MTDWTPEEDEAFNEAEKNSNLGKQILRGIEGQPYVYPSKREWVGLTDEEILEAAGIDGADTWLFETAYAIEAKLKQKNIG